MPKVYHAQSIVDAQLVLDELKAAGLSARISGGYLHGAIGEVPPGDVVSVWIDSDRHYDRARAVVKEFEEAQRDPNVETGAEKPCPKCKEMLAPQFGKCWNCGAWQTD